MNTAQRLIEFKKRYVCGKGDAIAEREIETIIQDELVISRLRKGVQNSWAAFFAEEGGQVDEL